MLSYEIVDLAFASIMVVALIGVITMIVWTLIESIKERNWFSKFENDVISGTHSIHKIMRALGYKKG